MRCGLPLGRLTFLRYSASASLAGTVSLDVVHERSEPVEASSLYSGAPLFSFGVGVQVIFLGQCMPRIFLRYLLWKVLTVFSSFLGMVHSSLL